jgi:hypothetical protein
MPGVGRQIFLIMIIAYLAYAGGESLSRFAGLPI